MWSKCVFWLRLLAAVFAGVSAVASVYDFYATEKLPSWIWPWTWGIAMGIVMFDNVGTLISRKISSARSRRRQGIEKTLMGMIIRVSKEQSIPFDEIGASVYVPYPWDVLRGRKHEDVRLKRIIRYRPAGYPQQSGVNWASGKGMVGQCWESRSPRYMNTHKVAQTHGGSTLTDAQLARLSKSTQCGFSVADFNAISGKYSEIHAEPLWHGRKERAMIGVLSIDRAYIAEDDKFTPKLNKKQTREVAAAVASLVSDILKPRDEEG